MTMTAQTMQGSPHVDPAAFWAHGHDLLVESSLPISPSQRQQFSPSSSTTESFSGHTSHTATPPSENGRKDSDHSMKSTQKESNSAQARASVAVACVPCRSRHLKCDGGVRCSRCRTDNVDCTYIKSRRGWKGKRKNKEDNGGAVHPDGAHYAHFCIFQDRFLTHRRELCTRQCCR
jgi:hypothetical protein